jgi:hypothetical protein
LKKEREKMPDNMPSEHPCLRGPFDDRIDQRSLLPPHLANRVLDIWLRARWRVWKIYKRYRQQKDERMGLK